MTRDTSYVVVTEVITSLSAMHGGSDGEYSPSVVFDAEVRYLLKSSSEGILARTDGTGRSTSGESSSRSRLIGDGVAGSLKLNMSAKSGISSSNSTRARLVLSFNFLFGVGSGVFSGVLIVVCRLGIDTIECMDYVV